MMKTTNGVRQPIVPRQLSTGEWIAERSDACYGIGQTPEAALRNLKDERLSDVIARLRAVKPIGGLFS